MKFTKKITNILAVTAMSAMLLATTTSASDIKTPNMASVSVQYSAMVSAANDFDSNLGSLIVDALTKNCYTVDALNNMIAATNNAITALNNVKFIDRTNTERGAADGIISGLDYTGESTVEGKLGPSLVRPNGFVSQVGSNLSLAQLPNAVSFGFSTAKSDGMVQVQAVSTTPTSPNPTSEYFDTLDFKVSTPLYSTGTSIRVVAPVSTNNNSSVDLKGVSNVIDKLNKYVTLLNRVKDFDTAAGCYNITVDNTQNTTQNTTTAPNGNDLGTIIEAEDITINVGDDFDIMNGVYAEDSNGNDVTDRVTTRGEVNTAVPGTYKITYSVNGVSQTITVTVVTTVSDAIIEASNTTLTVGDFFDPYGDVYAIDDAGRGNDISNLLTYTGFVDTGKVGAYTLVYSVIGENGNKVIREITITVEKATPNAVIHAQNSTIKVGEDFDPLSNVTAFDQGGKGYDLTDEIILDGSVDTTKEGTYTLTYSVIGENGVEVTKVVTVTVVNDFKDAVILAYDRTIKVNTDFDKMKDVRAYDNNGGGKDITGDVKVDGYVDIKVPGEYLVTYSVIGANKIKVSKEVIITVVAEDVATTNPNCTICGTVCNCTTCKTGNCTLCVPTGNCTVCNTTSNATICNTTSNCTICGVVNCTSCNTTSAPAVTAPTTCLPVCVGLNLCFKTVTTENTTCDPLVITVDPIKVEIVNTTPVDDTGMILLPNTEEPQNIMRPTGTNLAELVLSGLSLLGTVFVSRKRK